jgi:hypothetical protein
VSQSSVTVWALLALFFVYITGKGELPAYMGVFIGSTSGGGSASSGTAGQAINTVSQGLQTANQASTLLTNAGNSFGFGNQDFSGGESGISSVPTIDV